MPMNENGILTMTVKMKIITYLVETIQRQTWKSYVVQEHQKSKDFQQSCVRKNIKLLCLVSTQFSLLP